MAHDSRSVVADFFKANFSEEYGEVGLRALSTRLDLGFASVRRAVDSLVMSGALDVSRSRGGISSYLWRGESGESGESGVLISYAGGVSTLSRGESVSGRGVLTTGWGESGESGESPINRSINPLPGLKQEIAFNDREEGSADHPGGSGGKTHTDSPDSPDPVAAIAGMAAEFGVDVRPFLPRFKADVGRIVDKVGLVDAIVRYQEVVDQHGGWVHSAIAASRIVAGGKTAPNRRHSRLPAPYAPVGGWEQYTDAARAARAGMSVNEYVASRRTGFAR